MIVGPHTPGMVQTFTPFQFGEAETSVVIFGTLSGAVTNDNLDKPKLFG